MNIPALQIAVNEIKSELEAAISTASCLGKQYPNGQKAKEALIRSQRLIMKIHEVTKRSLLDAARCRQLSFNVHPPLGASAPELSVTGFIKAKQQDVVLTRNDLRAVPETIAEGALEGEVDTLGREASEKAIVVGVRSQMSSVAKNFDTLMERAFAETLNLRLRLTHLVMGEVYLLPVVEYDDTAMVHNRVAPKNGYVPVAKFIKTFLGISGRQPGALDSSLYKYDRSCLVLIDCRRTPPRIFTTLNELKAEGIVPRSFDANYAKLSPVRFADELMDEYVARHRH